MSRSVTPKVVADLDTTRIQFGQSRTRVIVQVKSGHVRSGDIRDLVGTLDHEGGAIGVFIRLEKAISHITDEKPPQPVSSPPNNSASSRESKS